MVALKRILDAFSQATGLVINFHKSTFVPMHVGNDTAAEMASVLGCSISTFPQTYRGFHCRRTSSNAQITSLSSLPLIATSLAGKHGCLARVAALFLSTLY